MYTRVENPAIRNYGQTSEPHTGVRSVFYYDHKTGKSELNWVAGGEWQIGFPVFETYKNKNGIKDTLLFIDEANNKQNFIFSQVRFNIHSFTLMAGASINLYKTEVERFSPAPAPLAQKTFSNEWAPRLSLSYQFGKTLLYAGYSKGFSPPSLLELNPTGSNFIAELQPEYGSNYDLGLRTEFGPLKVDINAFKMHLNNTIILQRDSLGGDYYINSGKTNQTGLETALSLPIFPGNKKIHLSQIYLSHTWHDFHFLHTDHWGNDSSGKEIPGVARHSLSAGMDVEFLKGLSVNLHYFFSDRIPLNDANSAYANTYHLLGCKLGYTKATGKNQFRIYAGCENILNEQYSLGNDINGFGGRYYNAAPERNYYVSIRWDLALNR
jgi:iron complex outermembrane receptor protein